MLKIKDSVDLKELKKFGIFEYWGYWNKDEFTKSENVVESSLYVHTRTRIMSLFGGGEVVLDTVFDLIQARLVEKVEENEQH